MVCSMISDSQFVCMLILSIVVEFNGYVIPKGTIIFGNLDTMHEDPNLYDNPHEFIVDRFLDKPTLSSKLSKATPAERDHYAFGWGR